MSACASRSSTRPALATLLTMMRGGNRNQTPRRVVTLWS